jgi:putative tricarboxylic transport membrane protein
MDSFIAGIDLLARWDVLAALLIGSIGGVLIGRHSGVGPPVAIAILLPATFGWDPIVGLTAASGHLRQFDVWRRHSRPS